MSSHATLFLVGLFLAALPFLGFPHAWDDVLITFAGIMCMAVAFMVRSERARAGARSLEVSARVEAFVETKPKRARRTRVRVVADVSEPREAGIARGWPSNTLLPEHSSSSADVRAPERMNFPRENERATSEVA